VHKTAGFYTVKSRLYVEKVNIEKGTIRLLLPIPRAMENKWYFLNKLHIADLLKLNND
jgi:hypothetical protein